MTRERDERGKTPRKVELDLSEPVQLILKVPGSLQDLTLDIATQAAEETPGEERFVPTPEDRHRALAKLTRSGRRFISFSTAHEGTKWSGENLGTMSSEGVDRTWDAKNRSEEKLKDSIDNALYMGVKLDRIMDSLRQIGMTIRVAETHMGETSGPVQEQVQGAKMIVRRESRRANTGR